MPERFAELQMQRHLANPHQPLGRGYRRLPGCYPLADSGRSGQTGGHPPKKSLNPNQSMPARLVSLAALLGVSLSLPAQANKGLYDPSTFRTLKLKFSQTNFKQLIITNKTSEKYIKAELTVDGKVYKNVGVRGRGGQTWGRGQQTGKLPLKIAMDEFVPGQRLMGRRSLDLGVCYEQSFLREALAFRMMRKYIPAPEANFVKVVCNGKSWGVYLNIEVPNKDFLENWYEDSGGNRYKGFSLGDKGPNPESYKT